MDNLIAGLSTIMLLLVLMILLLRSIKKDYEKRHPEVLSDPSDKVHHTDTKVENKEGEKHE